MKRGEIWTAAGGADYAGKPRPVLILQDDLFADTASITICLLTSHDAGADLFRPAIEPTPGNGLLETTYAMADKVTTVPRARLRRRIGRLSPNAIAAVNRAVMLFLGLAAQTGAPTTSGAASRRTGRSDQPRNQGAD